jgi:uncharacterized membrane protein
MPDGLHHQHARGGANTGVMLLWGLIITVLIAVSLLFYSAGLIVIGPLLGCASWHAYKASVRAESKETLLEVQ